MLQRVFVVTCLRPIGWPSSTLGRRAWIGMHALPLAAESAEKSETPRSIFLNSGIWGRTTKVQEPGQAAFFLNDYFMGFPFRTEWPTNWMRKDCIYDKFKFSKNVKKTSARVSILVLSLLFHNSATVRSYPELRLSCHQDSWIKHAMKGLMWDMHESWNTCGSGGARASEQIGSTTFAYSYYHFHGQEWSLHHFLPGFIDLYIYIFIHLFILFICLLFFKLYLFTHLFFIFIYLSIYLFIYSFIHSFIHLFIYSFIYSFIYLLIY